jgi:hypothetical protein
VEGVVAVGLMLLGAALVVTGRTDWSLSRRSWPVWLGAALIVVLIATSSTFGLGGALSSVSFGNKSQPATPGKTVHGGFGNLTVALPAQLHPGGPIKVTSVAGKIDIEPPNPTLPVPVPYHVAVNARVFAGQICANGTNQSDGLSASSHQTFDVGPADKNSPTLNLDVRQMFGQILINGPGCARR